MPKTPGQHQRASHVVRTNRQMEWAPWNVTDQRIAEIDDRTLSHLQIVIFLKLQRDERFTFRLAPADGKSGPLTVLWMTSSLPLRFTYSSDTRPIINTAWLQRLADAAGSSSGLWIVPEPELERPQSPHGRTVGPQKIAA